MALIHERRLASSHARLTCRASGGGHGSSSDNSGSGKLAEPDAKAAARAAASQTFSDEDLQQSRLTLAFRGADAERRFELWQVQQLQTVMHPISAVCRPAVLLHVCSVSHL